MDELLNKLAQLADELDKTDDIELANEVDGLMKELRLRQEHQFGLKCPVCGGKGYNDEEPFCRGCQGEGAIVIDAGLNGGIEKVSFVRQVGDEWEVLSHKGKILGKYKTKAEANKRLRQIEFWKNKGK